MSWKGTSRAIERLPQHFRTKTGLGTSTHDTEYDDTLTRFKGMQTKVEHMYKDAVKFRDNVSHLLNHQAKFSDIMVELYNPIVGKKVTESTTRRVTTPVQYVNTVKEYQKTMDKLRNIILPELDHMDNIVVMPLKDFIDIIKMINKTITKREHKKVDFDRYTVSVKNLQGKKDKSLSEAKSLFKAEENLAKATGEYEHYNDLLKKELPIFFEYRSRFIESIVTNFYHLQLKIYGILYEKMDPLITNTGHFEVESDVVKRYNERKADVKQQMEQLTLLQRGDKKKSKKENSSFRHNNESDEPTGSRYSSKSSTYKSKDSDSEEEMDAPPAYSTVVTSSTKIPTESSSVARSPSNSKLYPIPKVPPPLPPQTLKPKPKYVRALYDYDAQAEGDLSFRKNDKIEVIHRTPDINEWWKGKLNGVVGVFPGNYVEDW